MFREQSELGKKRGGRMMLLGGIGSFLLLGVVGGIGSGCEDAAKVAGLARKATVVKVEQAKESADLVMVCGKAATDDALLTVPHTDKQAIGIKYHSVVKFKLKDTTERTGSLIDWEDRENWSKELPLHFQSGKRRIMLPDQYMESMQTPMRSVGNNFVKRGFAHTGEFPCPDDWQKMIESPEDFNCLEEHFYIAFIAQGKEICAAGMLEKIDGHLRFKDKSLVSTCVHWKK